MCLKRDIVPIVIIRRYSCFIISSRLEFLPTLSRAARKINQSVKNY